MYVELDGAESAQDERGREFTGAAFARWAGISPDTLRRWSATGG